jgi:hypothetical protein
MKSVSAAHAVNVLNEALAADPVAVTALVAARVPCAEALADHESIQVSAKEGVYSVGILGILNGIFGIRDDGMGFIAAVVEDDGTVSRFAVLDELEAESTGEGEPN